MVKKAQKIKETDEIMSLKAQLARALADYDNLRKRVEKQTENLFKTAGVRIAIKLIPILDMLYQAQIHTKDSGVAIAINEFEQVLAEEGIKKIELNKGNKFDENLAEVVETVENRKGEPGTIERVILTGWKMEEGPVIRPAKVEVNK